ncbi:hypothetical protein CY35_11G112500 [Sphagnum magellanicum]|nr:hypothetical protein CY35_11G112500 [Sphagnum magellanicum]
MNLVPFGGKSGPRPRMLVCYLCGREFGSKSLPIHIPQCQKKWMIEEEKNPPKERRPMPQPPPLEKALRSGDSRAIDEFNSEAFAAYEQTLEQCPHCQRTFVPKAFKHHQKACTARNPAKPAGTGLISNSLSNRLPPGAIAGSKHGNAKAKPLVFHNNFDFLDPSKKQKTMDEVLAQKVVGFPCTPFGKGHGGNTTTGAFCDVCGSQFNRPNSRFCSQCGTKRAEDSPAAATKAMAGYRFEESCPKNCTTSLSRGWLNAFRLKTTPSQPSLLGQKTMSHSHKHGKAHPNFGLAALSENLHWRPT